MTAALHYLNKVTTMGNAIDVQYNSNLNFILILTLLFYHGVDIFITIGDWLL